MDAYKIYQPREYLYNVLEKHYNIILLRVRLTKLDDYTVI